MPNQVEPDFLNVCVSYPAQLDRRPAAEQERSLALLQARSDRIRVFRVPYGGAPVGNVPPLDETQRAAFAAADIVFAGHVPTNLGKLAPRLRWVQTIGADIAPLRSVGLDPARTRVTNGAGLLAVPIAEFVIGRILAHWKKFDVIAGYQREAKWTPCYGRDLAGSRLGIVGFGAIGAALATRASALGMHVAVASRRAGDLGSAAGVAEFHAFEDLDAMLQQCDAVVLCAADSPENRNLMSAARFGRMKPGGYFVNVARGGLVDEAALIAALDSGHLAGAAIDVAVEEPLPPENPLWHAPNLAISGHCSASVDRFVERGWALFLDNLDRFLTGRELMNLRRIS